MATFSTPSLYKGRDPDSPVFIDVLTITGENPHPAGGYLASAGIKAKIGAGRTILAIQQSGDSDTYIVKYNRATDKLVYRKITDGTEPTGDNLSANVIELTVFSY